ncbi:hypothetical protein FE257_003390 [Aspergillus nanangensis]|uniref:25S rRNA (uridine-N(3))-methyltransferase BMT5-like domain-containing protein n=1 Tax=Aspergillus nanangensis TaxID=2582783 RepID=A0AAD4CBN9_ASPNN|nr:hypothetical protein FE257_003390 [Aspergillus nanangensis]
MNTFSKLSTSAPNAHNNNNHNNNKETPTPGKNSKPNPSQRRPTVPFGRKDRILLIGEGDFSFARSLVEQHRCRHVLATCYDSKETLYSKYPQVDKNVQSVLGAFTEKPKVDNDEQQQASTSATGEDDDDDNNHPSQSDHTNSQQPPNPRRNPHVLFSIDARKLGSTGGGGKEIRAGFPRRERKRPAWQEAKRMKESRNTSTALSPVPQGGPWDVICFNFPHVGGLSTDVNRQVRANQELLVAFFKACVPLLSPRPEVDEDEDDEDEWESSNTGAESDSSQDGESELSDSGKPSAQGKPKHRTDPGQILVTLFEGEPYTLWNIRDLARHAGLQVITSFKFPWASYKGYSHARTLGEVEGKHGGRGGWRGEDREARMYVFELRRDDLPRASRKKPGSSGTNTGARSKRARDTSNSDDSD